MSLIFVFVFLFPASSLTGVLWESRLQTRRPEALPHPGHQRHGSLWALEDGPVQELPAPAPWWTWLLGYWRWFPPGPGSTEFRGEVFSTFLSSFVPSYFLTVYPFVSILLSLPYYLPLLPPPPPYYLPLLPPPPPHSTLRSFRVSIQLTNGILWNGYIYQIKIRDFNYHFIGFHRLVVLYHLLTIWKYNVIIMV